MRIDLNSDLGEGCTLDAEIMPLITSANIACGGHVGPEWIEPALRLAKAHGVQVGAHPGFLDRAHFGRRELHLPPARVEDDVRRQVALLRERAAAVGVAVTYLKPHGALYNMACRDDALAGPLARVAREGGLALLALPGSRLEAACQSEGVPFVAEGFADRRYLPGGSLVPRGSPGAFVEDIDEAVRQARWLTAGRGVRSLCVHGDNPRAVAFVRALREALQGQGATVAPFGEAG